MIIPSFPQTFPYGVLPIKCNRGKTCPPLYPSALYFCTSLRATGVVFLNKTVVCTFTPLFFSCSLVPFPTAFHTLYLNQCPPCLLFCFETVDLALLVGLTPFCYLNVQIPISCLSPTFRNVTRSCRSLFLILTVPTGWCVTINSFFIPLTSTVVLQVLIPFSFKSVLCLQAFKVTFKYGLFYCIPALFCLPTSLAFITASCFF